MRGEVPDAEISLQTQSDNIRRESIRPHPRGQKWMNSEVKSQKNE
jgi:hypothetical protein